MTNSQSSHKPPYGLWHSPITPRSLASSLRLNDVQWDSDGSTLVWLESRSGVNVLVCADMTSADAARDLTSDLHVRAQVGYGGGDFTVGHGMLYFIAEGRIYCQSLHYGAAMPITPACGYAAAPVLSPNGEWLIYVHTDEHTDSLVVVNTDITQLPQRIVQGHDFYMQPCWHPSGTQIAYVAWNHPAMPWDESTLFLATLYYHDDDAPPTVATTRVIHGNAGQAVFQPTFSPDGTWLAYVCDATGWGQLYLYHLPTRTTHQMTNETADYSRPAWIQGLRSYGWGADSRTLYAIRNTHGTATLHRYTIDIDIDIDAESVSTRKTVTAIDAFDDYMWLEQIAIAPQHDTIALIASSSVQPDRVVTWQPTATTTTQPNIPTAPRIMRRMASEQINPSHLSSAIPITWAASTGAVVHGLLFRPAPGEQTTHATTMPEGLPPAIVKVHGGPTSQMVARYQHDVQFFTTRGYVVLLVNYRGSTGYGRAYMDVLRHQWGIVDVDDVVHAATYLATQGIADRTKMVVMGGSAGGYTVLETLCHAPGVFRAGICLYGVTNLFTLAADTHKFEAHYLDTLIGTLPAASDAYRQRSPVFHADKLTDPLAIFQGDDDRVVPLSQAEAIVASLCKRGIPHEYHRYAGEGHGWRKRETIEAFYTAVDAFLRQYVVFA